MEPNWLIIIIVIVAAILLIVFLIWRNLKDKNELVKKIIREEELALPKEPDNELETND